MTVFNRNRYLAIFFLFLNFLSTSVVGQMISESDDCTSPQLEIYADSLDILNLAYQPIPVLLLSDSLFQQYGNLDCPTIIRMKTARANAYELLYNFEAALEIYNDILNTVIKNKFIEEEIAIRLSLARLYETISRPELCIENLNKAKALIDEHGYTRQLSRYYIRSSSYQRIFKDKALAIKFAEKAIQLGQKDSVARSVADGNLLLGLLTEDFEKAIQYSNRASKLFFELGDYKGGMAQQMNVAIRYLRRGAFEEALTIIDSVETYTDGLVDNDKIYYSFKTRIAKIKADIFEQTGDKDQLVTALKNNNEYSRLFGFLVNQEHINQLLIDNSVRLEKEKVAAANRRNRLLFIGLIGLLGIIILLSRLFYLNTTKKNKIEEQSLTISKQYQELEQLYNYQSTLLREVHHRIKNNLQLIISLLTLQKAKLENVKDADMLDMLCYRINSISLIHEQLYNSKEFDKIDVGFYIENLLKNFNALLSEQNVDIEHKVDNIQLNLDTITPLGLIWSELISNSLKYNQQKDGLKIYFDLIKKEKVYAMHYYDNGNGYPNGQFSANKKGMGFTIISSLSRQLSTTPYIYNSDGAHFTLAFKEKTISPL